MFWNDISKIPQQLQVQISTSPIEDIKYGIVKRGWIFANEKLRN
jgi:hypothetical protein